MHKKLDCPIKNVGLYELEFREDFRGWLTETWRTDEQHLGLNVMPPVMAYLSMTKPEETRGPHEHVVQWDRFVFFDGQFSLCLWENRERTPALDNYRERLVYVVGKGNPVMVEVPPGVVHGYKNTGEREAYVLNLPNCLYAGFGKQRKVDEVRWEADTDSPFIMP